MTREIGGYFEWEMPAAGGSFHPGAALALKSARSCLAVLLRRERPRRVHVPYYICDGPLEPLAAATEIVFYPLDEELEVAGGPPPVAADERLLYVDYFALKSVYARRLEERYGERLWLDCTQAFFCRPDDGAAPAFNSARKFFGVPDGAYLYLPPGQELTWERNLEVNSAYRLDHLTLRLEGETAAGHRAFHDNEDRNGDGVAAISRIGRRMLERIDYETAAERRRSNYLRLHRALAASNRIPPEVTALEAGAVPFSYPYLPPVEIAHERLWERRVFVPVLWRECRERIADGFDLEKTLSERLLPLPVDQRYGEREMDRILAALDEVGARG